MLLEFATKNFMNFEDVIEVNFGDTSNYEFSTSAIKDNMIKTCLLYGDNGSGKTNLGYAIFDITLHLVDKEKGLQNYKLYSNLNCADDCVWFRYKFKFENDVLEYVYQKSSPQTLLMEQVTINDEEVISYDFNTHIGKVKLAGAESLNIDLTEKNISFVKYIHSNTVLEKNRENEVYKEFILFVENMLLFSSLEKNHYQGFRNGNGSVAEGIIKQGKVKEFQEFLKKVGIKYTLISKEIDGEWQLLCEFKKKTVNFYSVASRGTCSLALFFWWLTQMDKVSFLVIDEFDAFYHNNLAETVVEEVLKLENTQALLTTHNTDIMTNDLLRPDCYLQIINGKIKSFANSTPKELRKAHNLQKMYKSGAFGEDE